MSPPQTRGRKKRQQQQQSGKSGADADGEDDGGHQDETTTTTTPSSSSSSSTRGGGGRSRSSKTRTRSAASTGGSAGGSAAAGRGSNRSRSRRSNPKQPAEEDNIVDDDEAMIAAASTNNSETGKATTTTTARQPRDRSLSSRGESTATTPSAATPSATRTSPRRRRNNHQSSSSSRRERPAATSINNGEDEAETMVAKEEHKDDHDGGDGGDAIDTGTVLLATTEASPPPPPPTAAAAAAAAAAETTTTTATTTTTTTKKSSKSSSTTKKTKKRQQQQQQQSKEEEEPAASGDDAKTTTPRGDRKKPSSGHKESQQTKTFQTPPTTPISKPAPTVDVTVHRMRHCDYHPRPILCLASYTPSKNNDSNDNCFLLAVSRASGSVTLKAAAPKLRTVARVAGRAQRPLTSLCWLPLPGPGGDRQADRNRNNHHHHNRNRRPPAVLVGAGRHELCVVDFWHTGRCVAAAASGGGGVGALERVSATTVAAACQDGTVRLFRVAVVDVVGDVDSNNHTIHNRYQLLPICTLPSAGAAVLSLACCPVEPNDDDEGDDDDNDLTGSVLFAGVADGTIRRYDCTSGGSLSSTTTTMQWKATIRMTVECGGRRTPTRVWALKVVAPSGGNGSSHDGDGGSTTTTLVSGDSLGHVQFWDGRAGTLAASFDQNDHQADVLVLETSRDGTKVFASGVDSRVVCIERRQPSSSQQSNNNNTTSSGPWVLTHAQRPHTHDVKAAAIIVPKAHNGGAGADEILCTGGVDTKLCTYAVRDFGARRPRALYPWPSLGGGPIAVAPRARLLAMRRDGGTVDLYRLAAPPAGAPQQMAAPVLVPENSTHVLGTVQVKGMSNLSCSAVSADGQFLALTDSYALLLFRLNQNGGGDDDSGQAALVPSKISVPLPSRMASIAALRFVTTNQLLLATTDGRVRVISISPLDERDDNNHDDADAEMKDVPSQSGFRAAVVQTLDAPAKTRASKEDASSSSRNQSCLLPVHSVVASDNGRWFLTQRNSSGRNDGSIDIYRKVDDDSYQFWWALPSLGSSPVTAAAFLPTTADAAPKLAVACIDYAMYTFDVENRCLSEWSEKAGFPVSRKLPFELASRNDFPVRIGVNPASPSVALMGSFGAIVSMNTELDFPQHCRIFPETHVRSGKKRKRSTSVSHKEKGDNVGDDHGDNEEEAIPTTCTMCLRYNSMLYMDFVGEHEMVVVEQPWLNVVATFPDALQRKVYGT